MTAKRTHSFPRALRHALAWAAAWAVVGMAIEITEPDPAFIDVWVTALAIPGFLAGLTFAALLHQVASGHRLSAVALSRVATCSLLAGVLIGGLVVALGFPNPAAVIGTLTALSIATALGSVVLSRYLALPRVASS